MRRPASRTGFTLIEVMVGLVGGFSSTLLFVAFAHAAGFRVLLYLIVGIVGALVGLEIPLMMRILHDSLEFKELVSQVLTMDYLGALPLNLSIRVQADAGRPSVVSEPQGEIAGLYRQVARQVAVKIAQRAKDFSSKFPSITISKET